MKKIIEINGKKYAYWNFEKAINIFCWINLIVQIIFIFVNSVIIKNNMCIKTFVLGAQIMLLFLVITIFVVTKHNYNVDKVLGKEFEKVVHNLMREYEEKKEKESMNKGKKESASKKTNKPRVKKEKNSEGK